jgi:hypothetical protein
MSTASACGARPHPNTPSMRLTIINITVPTTTNLRHVLTQYLCHYDSARPHRSLDLQPPTPTRT